MKIDSLPKFPPLGDVTTDLGLFRLAISRIIRRIDDQLRYEFTQDPETVDLYLEALNLILDDDAARMEKRLAFLARQSLACVRSCRDPSCLETKRHELMFKVAQLIANTPPEIFEEKRAQGFLPGHSMN